MCDWSCDCGTEIDKINILQASLLAMKRAVERTQGKRSQYS